MRAVECHVLRWLPFEKEQRQPQLSCVLFLRSATHPLHARVIGNVSPRLALEDLATLDLPPATRVLGIVQAVAHELERHCHLDLLPSRLRRPQTPVRRL